MEKLTVNEAVVIEIKDVKAILDRLASRLPHATPHTTALTLIELRKQKNKLTRLVEMMASAEE